MVHSQSKRAQKVTFTHPEKVLFPKSGVTKGEVIEYYLRVARWLLPHFRDRPCAVKRFPDGVEGKAFWEKDLPLNAPDWISHTFVPRKSPNEPPIKYAV